MFVHPMVVGKQSGMSKRGFLFSFAALINGMIWKNRDLTTGKRWIGKLIT